MPNIDVARWARFVISGGANTAITYVIYLLLNYVIDYQIAYAIAFFLGVVFSFYMNGKYVFRAEIGWTKFLRFPLIYAVQYAVAAFVLGVLVTQWGVDERIAPLLVLCVTMPLTYLAVKFALLPKGETKG